ncbi:MAG: MFS transporter [Candidatus Krumholzibacteria bacterium]|nr:MFS transporter [Candidatus Krumholzibacteria bacterium]
MITGGRRRILASVSLFHACNDGSGVVLPAIFPLLYTQGTLIRSYSDIGTTILVGLIVSVVFQAWVGWAARPRHSGYWLALDALIVGISFVLLTGAASFWMLMIYFVGVRLGTSIFHPVGISWISHTFAGEDLDHAMGFQSAFGNIGVLVAFASTGFIAQHAGWKVPLFAWGAVNLAVVAAGLLLARGTTDRQERERQKLHEREPVSWVAAFLGFRSFIPMMVLGGFAWGVTINYAPSLLNHRLGLSMSATGVVMGLWMCAGTISAFFYGKLAERFSRARALVWAYAVVSIVSFVFGLSGNIPLTFAAFALYGIAIFITYPANLSFISSTVEPRNRTAAFSLASNVMIIGNSIFSYFSGRISDAFGIHAPFILLGVCSVLVLGHLVWMIATGRIEAPGCRIIPRLGPH